MEEWLKAANDKNTTAKELLNFNKENLEYVQKMKNFKLPHFKAKFLPKNEKFGSIDCAIYRNNVYIISLERHVFGIKIESQLVADTFRTMYNLAWQAAVMQTPPKKKEIVPRGTMKEPLPTLLLARGGVANVPRGTFA